MKAADEDICPEMGGDVEDAAVRTSAEEVAPPVLFDEQILLVPEIIWDDATLHTSTHTRTAGGIGAGHTAGRVQGDARCQCGDAFVRELQVACVGRGFPCPLMFVEVSFGWTC